MSQLTTIVTVVVCITMIVAAFMAIRGQSVPIAILAAGLVSLSASVVFLVVASPDVAMTEAAIGSGLTTFLLFFVLARVRGGEND